MKEKEIVIFASVFLYFIYTFWLLPLTPRTPRHWVSDPVCAGKTNGGHFPLSDFCCFFLVFSGAMLLLLLHFLDRRAQEAETSWSQEYERDIPEPRHHGCPSLLVRLPSSNELYLKSGDIPNQLVLSATTSFDLWTLEINRGTLSGVASLLLLLFCCARNLCTPHSCPSASILRCGFGGADFLIYYFFFLFDLNMQYGTIGVITGTFKFPFLAFFFNVEMLLGPLSPRRKK